MMPSSSSSGRLQHGVAAVLEMLDVADQLAAALAPLQQIFSRALRSRNGKRAQILAAGEQQVEREEDQVIGLAVRQRRLQRRKIRDAVLIERDDLAVDQADREAISLRSAMAPNFSVQSSPLRVFSATSPSSTRNCTR